MYIYLLRNNTKHGYGIYESVVVIANNEDDARCFHPKGNHLKESLSWDSCRVDSRETNKLIVHKIGEAGMGQERGVVASMLFSIPPESETPTTSQI